MVTKIQLKRSTTATSVPAAGDLDVGELAINTADSKLFHKNTSNVIIELGMSAAERSKLSGIAAGATVNSSDAALRDRATHTGAQAISTVTGLQTALDGKAPLASPALTGTPTAPTATAGTNTTQLATTAFVTAAAALKANLASPALTGTPTAPTATAGTSTTQLATTAFVAAAVTAGPVTLDGGTY